MRQQQRDKSKMHFLCLVTLILVTLISNVSGKQVTEPVRTLSNLWKQTRRTANLSGLFGSARTTSKTPYERVGNYPVFMVTTSWGASYMTFERLEDFEEGMDRGEDPGTKARSEGVRPVTLFYMDPEDALAMRQEMTQMENMQGADIRITSTTLSKAVRQASNFGDGLPTGSPVEPMTGKLPSINDGGSLRYKIVPSKRQLFYAARCKGREKVGHFGESAGQDAGIALDGIDVTNQERRRNVRKGKSLVTTVSQNEYRHMEGYTGIPVFYSPDMQRRLPVLKRFLGGTSSENPVFFSYEDLMETWNKMRKSDSKIPKKSPNVEVLNLMDVLTSMDRESSKQTACFKLTDPMGTVKSQFEEITKGFKSRFSAPGLDSISFIPASRAVDYKEIVASVGNNKARLRPMREWRPYI